MLNNADDGRHTKRLPSGTLKGSESPILLRRLQRDVALNNLRGWKHSTSLKLRVASISSFVYEMSFLLVALKGKHLPEARYYILSRPLYKYSFFLKLN